MAKRIDFERLKRDLLARAERLLAEWLPDGELSGREWTALNPRRSDSGKGSFRVNVDTGVWKDFALDAVGGGDLIALYAYLYDYEKMGDAARVLLGETDGKPLPSSYSSAGTEKQAKPGRPKWVPMFPAPSDPPADYQHWKFGTAVKRWIYRDAKGQALCGVYRFDLLDEQGQPVLKDGKPVKEFCPLTWCEQEGSGKRAWYWKGLPKPRPLYRLDKIAAAPGAALVFTEGEKAADAAQALFSGLPSQFEATCSIGGEGQWRQTDIEPARGRDCFIWRDNDEAGEAYAKGITGMLLAIGCKVAWIRIPFDAPAKWDAADALAEGWTSARVAGLIAAGEMFEQPEGVVSKKILVDPVHAVPVPVDDDNPPWPDVPNWHLNAHGLRDIKFEPICWKPVWVDAVTQDYQGKFGLLLKFVDVNGVVSSISVQSSILNEQGNVLGKLLQERGCPVVPGKEKWLCRFLIQMSVQIERRIHASDRLGWYDHPYNKEIAFILPSNILGNSSIELCYQPSGYVKIADNIASSGTLEDWQKKVRDPCRGNPFLMFALLMGLAGPLLKVVRESTGGFHFYGTTTGGKTTMLQVAASVWGCGADPQTGPEHTIIQSWDTSPTGLEEAAQLFNDMAMPLDELGKGDPEKVAALIYKLTGGISKLRGMAQGGMREQKTWRTLAISSGEVSVLQMFHRAGLEIKGGQRVRFPDIPVDDDKGQRAIIQDIHKDIVFDERNPANNAEIRKKAHRLFVEDLKSSASQYFGVAGPTFICYLVACASEVGWAAFCASVQQDMAAMELSAASRLDASGKAVLIPMPEELMRVTKRFALVGLAGFHAVQAGIINWTLEEIVACIRTVRDAWLSEQGEGKSETDRSLDHFIGALISNLHRFEALHDKAEDNTKSVRVRELIGFRYSPDDVHRTKDMDKSYFAITEDGFRELCGDYDARIIQREIKNLGLLWHEKDKLKRKSPRIPSLGNSRPYLYFVSAKILGEIEDDEETQPHEEGIPF